MRANARYVPKALLAPCAGRNSSNWILTGNKNDDEVRWTERRNKRCAILHQFIRAVISCIYFSVYVFHQSPSFTRCE